jgi:hypothetical protein
MSIRPTPLTVTVTRSVVGLERPSVLCTIVDEQHTRTLSTWNVGVPVSVVGTVNAYRTVAVDVDFEHAIRRSCAAYTPAVKVHALAERYDVLSPVRYWVFQVVANAAVATLRQEARARTAARLVILTVEIAGIRPIWFPSTRCSTRR